MKKAVYAGSFDPVTRGHLDIVRRASLLFDEVVVVVSHNPKKAYVFSIDERMAFVSEAVASLENVRVVYQEGGLTVEGARQLDATFLVRGVRNGTDLELEETLASHNHRLAPEIETVILLAHDEFRYVSASMVKELARYGGAYHSLVTESVYQALELYYESSLERNIIMKGDRQ